MGTDGPPALAAGLLTRGAVTSARINDGWIEVETSDAPAFRRSVAAVARDYDARLTEVRALDDDLESVFAYLVGRTMTDPVRARPFTTVWGVLVRSIATRLRVVGLGLTRSRRHRPGNLSAGGEPLRPARRGLVARRHLRAVAARSRW